MAQVEIYKLKKTADPAVREYGMFEFFGMVDGPLPRNYVREWAGEINSGNLETLCGRFMLNPPDGYHGRPLEKSDIAVVNGVAYFLDRESGYKFVGVNFDDAARTGRAARGVKQSESAGQSVLGRIAEAREAQRGTKTESRENHTPSKKPRGPEL